MDRRKTIVKTRLVFVKPLMNTVSLNVLPEAVILKFKQSPRKLFYVGVSDIINVMYIITRMVSVLNIREEEIKAYIETVINTIVAEIVKLSRPQLTCELTPFDVKFLRDINLDYKSLK